MNGISKMRRADAVAYIAGAAVYRRFACRVFGADLRADFITRARTYLRYAREDMGIARRAGWKLPG